MTQNIIIAGSSGRMGHALLESTINDPELKLHAALDRPDCPQLGKDAGEAFGIASGVKISTDLQAALKDASILVDFTRPEPSLAYLEACRQAGVGIVIGTTGFTQAQKEVIAAAARDIPVVFAPNMSVGVTLLINLVQSAAKVLAEGYDIEIIEAHHRHKVDAPSALRLGEGRQRPRSQPGKCGLRPRRRHRQATRDVGFAVPRRRRGRPPCCLPASAARGTHHKANGSFTFIGALRAAKFIADKRTACTTCRMCWAALASLTSSRYVRENIRNRPNPD